MATHKAINKICCAVLALTLLVTVLFANAKSFGVRCQAKEMDYESRLFQTDIVHTVDIVMEDWEEFLSTCAAEEYAPCTVVIDNEAYRNVAIRAKGNTSLTQVKSSGSSRYSFKIEFDHYEDASSYYGLDKLCLNNMIQDNTYMKDYLCYQMMADFGVAAPLCSFAYVTVNGEEWGLYLAVEAIEEAFLQRNYGGAYGKLYKPDSQNMGGGKGNGEDFRLEDWQEKEAEEASMPIPPDMNGSERAPEKPDIDEAKKNPLKEPGESASERELEEMQPPEVKEHPVSPKEGEDRPDTAMGADDVLLRYVNEDYESYAHIFDNAKTDIVNADKDRLISSLQSLQAGENLSSVVDTEAVLRYFVVHHFVCNFDSYTGGMVHNYYLYEKDGQMAMLPWDYNLAFGGFEGTLDAASLINHPIDTPVSSGEVEERPMLAWIFSNEGYKELYHQYFSEFIESYFDSDVFTDKFEKICELISPYVKKDPTKFCTYEEFETGVATLKGFCLLRAESVRGQLEGAIASTKEEQKENPNGMIEANGIEISAMGTMENTMERGQKITPAPLQ